MRRDERGLRVRGRGRERGRVRVRASMVAVSMLAASFGSTAGCDEPALDPICPELLPGQLVITEIRGSQSGPNTFGEWVELFNAGDTDLDLRGVRVTIRRSDGGGTKAILVRRSLPLAAGDYVVVGSGPPDAPPRGTDYGAGADFEGGMPVNGLVEIVSCDERVDLVVFEGLPSAGSWALDGGLSPDADANDDRGNWCVDDRPQPDDAPGTELGLPGSPGEENPPCP